MKFMFGSKDGGPESNVTMYGLESKKIGSVLLLRFGKGSREAFHSHAFNAISWVLSGGLREHVISMSSITRHLIFGRVEADPPVIYKPSFTPVRTPKKRFHKVEGLKDANWVLSFRGPWVDKWREYREKAAADVTLTHGRREL